MKKYVSFFKIKLINGLQYRAAAYAGVTTQFFWGFMEILIFSAFYKSNPNNFPMKFHELASYIWLQQVFLSLYMMWLMDNEIFNMIRDGGVAYELCRPMDLYSMWYAKNMASRLAKALLRCLPILIIAVILPYPYGISMPSSISSFIFFLISMILAFLVVVSFCMIIYVVTFFTISPLGVKLIASTLTEFLSGAVIPIPFLPDSLGKIIEYLPWASMQNAPFRIYSGNITGVDIINTIWLQFFWLIVLTVFGKLLLTIALKKVVVQGG